MVSRTDLPPLAAIRVFEEAARCKNFTLAADKLGMTQAAVSYQIKILEERVGGPLFIREARGVSLSEVGARFAEKTTEALNILSDAYSEAKGVSQEMLAISVIPTFATNFLAQHLGVFQMENPNMAVRVEVGENLVDFSSSGFDVGVRGGRGKWSGLSSHLLIQTRFTPMLSKELADSIGGVREPGDLMRLRILSPSDPWWTRWLKKAGLDATELSSEVNHQIGPQVLEANAAIAGQGVAMLTPAFFKDELATGRLIQPFDLTGEDGSGYWLVYPESHRNSRKIRRFRKWLEAETRTWRP
ncbi:MAG: LysR substrate-binding domain-containing protein [Pseudomonadota bacterium]